MSALLHTPMRKNTVYPPGRWVAALLTAFVYCFPLDPDGLLPLYAVKELALGDLTPLTMPKELNVDGGFGLSLSLSLSQPHPFALSAFATAASMICGRQGKMRSNNKKHERGAAGSRIYF